METVLVTGAAGHVGLNLVKGLLERGRKVRAMVNRNRNGLEDLDIEIVKGNILDRDSLDKALEGVEVVYHCAGKISIMGDPDGSVWATNVPGVKNIAEAAHAAGVVHGDLEPSHCWLVGAPDALESAELRLTDFGVFGGISNP